MTHVHAEQSLMPSSSRERSSPAVPALSADRFTRAALFMVTLLFTFLTAKPFPDLADPKLLEARGDGDLKGQIIAVVVTSALAAFVLLKRNRVVQAALTPALVLTLGWFALSAALSAYPGLAGRRIVLAVFTIFQAAVLLLLPQDREQFSRLMAAGAFAVLLLCYAGVLFAPDYSIHQASDLAEPELAGNWRGFFTHKNGAAAGMVVLIMVGLFVFRTAHAAAGALIVALAAVFLVFTESKSSIRLLPLVLVVSSLLVHLRSGLAKCALVIAPIGILALLTIGSVTIAPLQALLGRFLSDPSFTGRDDIWQFTLAHIAQRPLVGFGFQAFWGTPDLVSQWNYLESWGYRASDAHNGFLNLAVMTGWVGLLLSLLWIIAQPLADLIRTPVQPPDPALKLLFVRLWLFGLCLAGFESELFSGGSVVWFMTVLGIIGLRYQARAVLAREA